MSSKRYVTAARSTPAEERAALIADLEAAGARFAEDSSRHGHFHKGLAKVVTSGAAAGTMLCMMSAPVAAAAALLLSLAIAPSANADDVIASSTTQTRCSHHHVQKRTVTKYANPDGTVAAATTYGPWVTKRRSC